MLNFTEIKGSQRTFDPKIEFYEKKIVTNC